MAELKIGVKLDSSGLQSQLSALNGKYDIQVNVKTTDASKATVANLAAIARAQARIAKADATAAKSAAQLAKAQAQATKAQAQAAKAANDLAKTEAQVHAKQTELNKEIEKTNQLYAKKAVEAQKTATAQVQAKAKETQATANLVKEENKLAVEEQKTATALVQAKEKETQATANLVKEENKLAIEQEKTKQKALSAGKAHKQAASDVTKHSQAHNSLSQSLGTALMQFALIRSAVSGIKNAFRSALTDIKAVDKELVTVAKVSGLSGEGLASLTKTAYATGSKYGQSASTYLQSAGEFARAGYRGSDMEGMADLAVKTQIVGDVTAETANQFLLATAAAYGLQGNVSALSGVLDSANEIDNKYATSISKIAEGMGLVAPMAAQMNVSVNELMAGLGTITAVTQRTGTEAARALRALFLNIQAEVGNFEDENGDTIEVTEESIGSLTGLLEKYDKAAYDAAKSTGQVLNPMKAMASIAKAYQDGLLTANDLMNLSSALGGKLRSNQLQAILSHWDMYESMLSDASNATGSAEAEVNRYLDSWEAKTNQLDNTWTEFVSNIADTGVIKAGLDGVTGALGLLNNGFSGTMITVAALTVGVGALLPQIKAIGAAITASFASNPVLLAIAGIATGAAVIGGVISKINQYNSQEAKEERAETAKTNYANAVKDVETLNKALEENKKKIQAINSQPKISIVDQSNLSYLQNATKELEAQLIIMQQKAVISRNEAITAQTEALKGYSFSGEYYEESRGAEVAGLDLEGSLVQLERIRIKAKETAEELGSSGYSDFLSENYQMYLDTQNDLSSYILEEIESRNKALESSKEYYDFVNSIDESARTPAQIEFFKERNRVQEETNRLQSEYSRIMGEYVTQSEEAEKAASNTSEATNTAAGSLRSLADDASSLTDELAGATQALKDFNDVASGTQEGDTFKAYQEMLEKGAEYFEKNMFGNSTYQAALKTIFGDGFEAAFKAVGYDWGKLGATVFGGESFVSKLFNADDVTQVIDTLIEALEGTDLEGIITRVGNSFQITGVSAAELAESLGISEAAASAILDYLSQWAPALKTSTTDVESLGEKLKEAGGAFKNDDGSWIIDNKAFDAMMTSAGLAQSAIETLKANLEATGKVRFTNFDELPSKIQESENEAENLSSSLDKAAENRESSIDVSETGLEEVVEALDNSTMEREAPISAHVDQYKLGQAKSALESVATNYTATITVETVYTGDGAGSGGGSSGSSGFSSAGMGGGGGGGGIADYLPQQTGIGIRTFASGTDKAKSGKAFVNELEPELIIRGSDKQGYIANGGKPAVVTLGAGDAVIPLSEFGDGDASKQYVKNHAATYIPVYADPVIQSKRSGSGVLPGTKEEKAKSKSGGSSSNITSGKAKDTTDYLKTIKEYVEFQLSKIQTGMNELEHKITLIERERDALLKPLQDQTEQLNDANDALSRSATLLKRAQDAETKPLEKQVKELDKASKAISKQLKTLQKERDALVKPLQEQSDALEKANEEEEKRLELEEKQLAVEKAKQALADANERTVRVFNEQTGQWEWIKDAKTIKSAQESLDTAQKNLDDYLKKKEIQDIKDQISDIKDAYQEQIDVLNEQNDALSEQKDALNEQVDLINDAYEVQLEAIEDQQTAISDALYDLEQLQKQITRQYQEMIDPIDAQRKAMQEQYDDFNYEWSRIEAAFEENATNINQILQKFSKQQLPKMADAVEMVTNLLTELGGGKIGGTWAYNNAGAAVSSASDIATQFANTASVNGIMLGAGKPAYSGGGYTVNGTASTTNNNGNNYYINGVKIGGDMLSKPLSDVLSTLGIYTQT